MNGLSLKEHFERRAAVPLRPRIVCGRLFQALGFWGLADGSGGLWPIFLDAESLAWKTVKAFDVVVCDAQWTPVGALQCGVLHDHNSTREATELAEQFVPCQQDLKNWGLNQGWQESERFCFFKTGFFLNAMAAKAKILRLKNQGLTVTQNFFVHRHFLPIQTPSLVASGGLETYLQPFQTSYTDHAGTRWPLQLPTSPELALKKCLAKGWPKLFDIARAYRNCGEQSTWHTPEFTMLEWYRVGASLEEILQDTEHFCAYLWTSFNTTGESLPKRWPRFRVDQLFRQHMGLDLAALQDVSVFHAVAKDLSPSITAHDDWTTLFCKLFMEHIEPRLKETPACFVTHYPIQMAALAAPEPGQPFAQRAEGFLNGIEICNAYQELVDGEIFEQRIAETTQENPAVVRDPDFDRAMRSALPPCAGNALGWDRVMAICLGLEGVGGLRVLNGL